MDRRDVLVTGAVVGITVPSIAIIVAAAGLFHSADPATRQAVGVALTAVAVNALMAGFYSFHGQAPFWRTFFAIPAIAICGFAIITAGVFLGFTILSALGVNVAEVF